MKKADAEAFTDLFKEACRKCFGAAPPHALSETESRNFSNSIFDATGLVIGAKSLKNYSLYVLNPDETKSENPSVATLDTLARYVLNAPPTDEIQRKNKEGHHPYWFRYRSSRGNPEDKKQAEPAAGRKRKWILLIIALCILSLLSLYLALQKKDKKYFAEEFSSLKADSLAAQGWFLQLPDPAYWQKRGEDPGHLTLFTLKGDNWADPVNPPAIRNLLLRKITSDCFSAEVRLDDFIPRHDWQQAGLLLLEDTSFSGRSVRISLAFNDFFGGFSKPGEVIVQAISSNSHDPSRPEEILHYPVFSFGTGRDSLVKNELHRSALKIEKKGRHFRFLFAGGSVDNFAYRELSARDLDIHPRYIGIFALQGFVNNTPYLPARIKFFSMEGLDCNR